MPSFDEELHVKNKSEREKRTFEYMVDDFIKRWRSNDRYDGAQFEAQLITIIRQVYTDAQQPLLDQITKMAMAMPMLPQTITHK